MGLQSQCLEIMEVNLHQKTIDFCENFNIKIKTIAAEFPWSNGICEHHKAIITETLLKVKEDSNCNWETALAWALSAKNSLINANGFSPHQIVFGKNIKIPSIYVDQPSADLPENKILIRHLNVLHAQGKLLLQQNHYVN